MRSLVLVLVVSCSSPRAPVAPVAPAPAPVAVAAPPTEAERSQLRIAGMAAYERKDWDACAVALERAGDSYDAACCRAQAGQPELAFPLLEREIKAGFRNIKHLESDPDLASLHRDPRWQGLFALVATEIAAYRTRVNGELLDLFDADQADRAGTHGQIDWKLVNPRDEARRKRVDEIIAAGGAKVADDYYHAAMVYQHGAAIAEIKRAQRLALEAVAREPHHTRARWLAAAAEDRALMYDNKPQRYGTQYKKNGEGVWVLWDVDPATTDEDRANWNVPPLAQARARAAQMNAQL
ncbi:MAG: hypothetical protein WKG01_29245 [Kofleriaceae bacterium]